MRHLFNIRHYTILSLFFQIIFYYKLSLYFNNNMLYNLKKNIISENNLKYMLFNSLSTYTKNQNIITLPTVNLNLRMILNGKHINKLLIIKQTI